MVHMSLFSRNADLPGLQATVRDCTPQGKGFKRLSSGDIALIDAPDLGRVLAQRLADASPAAVVNMAQFTTGAMPNYGPQILLDGDTILVEGVGAEIREHIKDGKKVRLTDDGQLFLGDRLIGSGTVVTPALAERAFADAEQNLVDHMEAFFGNTIQFITSESPLLIDGLGVPETGLDFRERKVVVLSPGLGHRAELKSLRNFIREYDPVLIGVESAADTLVEAGYKPDLIVGDPANIGNDALRSGARVVLPAAPDGHAKGLERIQDLGIGAMTFPAASESATDLALLLADYHEAQLIVSAGSELSLTDIFRGTPDATPSALLTRTKLGGKLVEGTSISNLYTVKSSASLAWMWALLGILVALAVIVGIAGTSGNGDFVSNLIDTWNNIALSFQGLFR
ncbi:putative cytokinetic ring protein SteA [Corynebacterium epidermidicanis]|uniref:Putative membrane-anchored protein n=1 Tax=Corynebacterium epidermidicanis TaxID=1050174 RepID=A0A0G3GW02_9CORY|nr:putative cytokinetic ring protein SteA [Corynebacterium epidermidicanis]AKK03052.1 putative membrane-anchored protein [Corynebacterium epidermidicanis]